MGSAGWGMLLQLVAALAFWPVMLAAWRTGRSLGARLAIATALVLAFWGLSTGSYRMVTGSPARPEVILVGAPDGRGRAMATVDAGGPKKTRIRFRVWQRGGEAEAKQADAVRASRVAAAALVVKWDEDSGGAGLFERSFVATVRNIPGKFIDQRVSRLELDR